MKIRHVLLSVALLALGILGWAVGKYVGRTPVLAQQPLYPPASPMDPAPMMLPLPNSPAGQHLALPPVNDVTPPRPPVTLPPIVGEVTPAKPAPNSGPIQQINYNPSAEGAESSGDDGPSDAAAGKMEPCVTLQWTGPKTAKIGQPATYQILVKNVSTLAVHHVVVQNRLPAGVNLNAADPKPTGESGLQLWELGTLQPHQERRIEMQLLPESKGDLRCEASVTFSSTCSAKISVREPKLALKISSPPQVIVGDPVAVSLAVRNPGDGVAERVKVRATLPAGLENPRGKTLDFDVGNLAPNETRNLQIPCSAQTGGQQRLEAVATGAGNLSTQDTMVVEVIAPSLEVSIQGRDMLYLDRKTSFTVKVTNTSAAPAGNVNVSDVLPPGFKFVSASDQGQHDVSLRSVSWYVGDLAAGESKEVKVELQAVEVGEHLQRASATGARGATAEGQLGTRVEGVSALAMEVRDLDNPVEVNADTGFDIHVVNSGTRMETGLVLVCTLPEKMEFKDAVGPGGLKYNVNGREIVFEPIPKLAPRADVTFRINARGIAPGDHRFRALLKADGLGAPIVREETTKVY
jgi:uncharacterized repeat protein (TIGR01451 family)